ncbi:hypothetical protein AHAS_Ahas11G0147100 [Arachis hypogaea]
MGKPKLLESRCSPCYIADLFKELETNQDQAKLDEIEEIGFGFLKLVPKWQVRQGIMVMLAKAYDTETSTLKLENGNIRIMPELFQRLFGIPPGGEYTFTYYIPLNWYHRLKTVQLRHFVRHCPMDTEDDRMEFRRHFILLVLKMFLCPTVQHVISPWHIDTVLDVSDPVLYFQKLKHGELEGCQEPDPWFSAWTAKELSAIAETIQPEDYGEPGRNEDYGKEDAAIEETSDPSPEQVDVDHRKVS